MSTTLFVVLFLFAIPLGWEFYTFTGDIITISEAVRNLGHEWNAFIIYAVSVLPGHFFVNFNRSLVERAGGTDATEIALVLWIGWGIFAYFRANPEVQLGPWSSLGLVIASVLIGAFLWSIKPVG